MKWLAFLFFLSANSGIAQQSGMTGQRSSVNVKGNANIIKVIQGTKVTIFDLNDEEHRSRLLTYLEALPSMKQDLKKLLQHSKKVLEIVTRAADSGVLDQNQFLKIIEQYIRDNERLRIENEQLKKQSKDPDFVITLISADKKLEEYDNAGYQEILEAYKLKKKIKIIESIKELANASYLQSVNNVTNLNFLKALEQINESLALDSQNVSYLLLQARIFYRLFRIKESLEAYMKALPAIKDDVLLSGTYDNIGVCYHSAGDYDKALEYYKESLAVEMKISPNDNERTATVYTNIGSIFEAKGSYDEAISAYHKALAIYERLYGVENISVGNIYNNIGMVYSAKGQFEKALQYYKKDLLISEKNMGKEHPHTAFVYINIGTIYTEKGEYEKALEYYDKSRDIFVKVYGTNYHYLANINNNIGAVYAHLRQDDKAIQSYTMALEILERTRGQLHPDIATTYNNIGRVYHNKKDYNDALKFYNKALAIQQSSLGETHISIATSYYNVGEFYFDKSNYDSALVYFNKSYDIQLKILGLNHPHVQSILVYLGVIYVLNGEKAKGLTYLHQNTLSNYKKSFILNDYAFQALHNKRYRESISIYLVALDFLKKSSIPKSDTLVVIVYQNLANAYCGTGDKSRAKELFEKAFNRAKSLNLQSKFIENINKEYNSCL